MYKNTHDNQKMLLPLLISHSIANPIQNSTSGSASNSGSGSTIQNTITNDNYYTCQTECKIFTYMFIIMLCCCLATLCGMFIACIYDACIQDMIHSCIKCTKQKCIRCKKYRTRDNKYIEKEYSYYDKFIIMYNSMYKKDKPLNSECPICLEPINKNFYTLHCKHAYHTNCMEQYINSDHFQDQCALCRNIIDV